MVGRLAKKMEHKWLVLTLLAIAQFMVVLDVSIVNVALPSIEKDLGFSPTNLQWIVTAYTLAFGGFLLLGGRAADLFGRRKVFMGGVAAFGLASLLTGLAHTESMLIVGRAIQGLAGAFMSPAALSIVITTFKEGAERNKALGVWGAVAAGGAAAGVLLGGVITEYLGWEWNFFVNIPVALFVFVMASRYVPESKPDVDHKNLDLAGAALVTGGLILLVYGLTEAPSKGWTSSATLAMVGGAVGLLVAFLVNEARSKHPLMPLKLFKIRNVLGANLTQLPITASLFSMFFFLTLYIQTILMYSPIQSGLSFLPTTFVIGAVAAIMSSRVTKYGYKWFLVVAPLLMAFALFMFSRIPVDGTYFVNILPWLIVMAIGLGMSFVSLTIAATSGVPHHEAGLASGLLNTSQQIGGALGLAILSGVAASRTTDLLAEGANPAYATVQGYHSAFHVGIVFALLASLSAFTLLKNKKGAVADSNAAAVH